MSDHDPESGGADDPGRAEAVYAADPYDYGEARALMDSLDLAEPVAVTLVRRGHRTPEQARAFIDAADEHDPTEFDGIEEAVGLIASALESGRRITVHGDYDVDGIAATAILVSALRRLGGECDWLIPDRSADGYGLSAETIERLRERGTGLLITADCGIASPDEIALAAAAGIEAIVTDHHQPGETLPDCPIVHPEVCGYPFEGLCGAAVAHKLVLVLEQRLGPTEQIPGRDLDLVALATIADLVPLLGENRTLARRGIAELRRARRPGVRALLEVSRVEPEHLDEGDIAFRLAPRINAAGRLYRADAGVELMITDNEARAAEIAAELDAANRERRNVEREVSNAAEASLRELPPELREAPGIVLAGADWHPGVVGIAASRVVERHGRPAILLSVAEGRARGSGRGIPGFDLLAALNECSEFLDRFGGHRAAAGVELDAGRVEEFREAFARAAGAQLPDGAPPQQERIDAVVGAEALDLTVAEQLGTLGPFGQGNPAVRLLVPWAQVGDVRPMGKEGKHARFSLSSGSAKASGVAFNAAKAVTSATDSPRDLTVRLELNHWNGATEPRAVLDRSRGGEGGGSALCGCPRDVDGAWWERFEGDLAAAPTAAEMPDSPSAEGLPREPISHRDRSAVALIGELLSSGSRVLVLCADARRRAELASLAASPARFGGTHAILCGSCPDRYFELACDADHGARLLLTDWDALGRRQGLTGGFRHVVAVDPPPSATLAAALVADGPGFVHRAWAGAGELPELCWTERWQPRAALAEIYRGLLARPRSGADLGVLLAGEGTFRRPPEVAARCVRVLSELGIAELGGESGARALGVVSSERTELERSGAWRALAARHREGLEFLQSQTAN